MAQLEYRNLDISKINRELFARFERRQIVTRCWRKIDGEWILKEINFVDEWNEDEYSELIARLKSIALKGGFVFGAFSDGFLKGFVSVTPNLFGNHRQYLDLSELHVSEDMRNLGIGKSLFFEAAAWSKKHGAKKLYISAHSSEESQAFYRAVGCVEALEYDAAHVEKEPCDCQMEYVL